MYYYRFFVVILLSSIFIRSDAQNISFNVVGDEERIEVPFKFIHNFIVVEMRLFGMLPVNFIFDTGAENTVLLTRQFADFMNIEYDTRIPILGSDLSTQVHALVARSVKIELIGLPPQRRDILVLEENTLNLSQITGTPIHGLLGGSFFRNTVVEIDYKKQRLIFHDSNTYVPPKGQYIPIKIDVERNKPYIQAEAILGRSKIVDISLLLDTGAGLPLLLNNDSHPALTLPDRFIRGQLGFGLGGLIEGYVGRVNELKIADEINLSQVITSFQEMSETVQPDSVWARNGLVGNQLLVRFHVIIDYLSETLYLRPRSGYRRDFKMDRSGLILFATGISLDEYVISDLISGSPAELAGLQKGDKLIKVQGLPARLYSLDQINRVMQKREGKLIRLNIQRGTLRYKYTFRLRTLI